MLRLALSALALCAALLAVGCGDDGEDSTASGDVKRYCGLVRELDRAGQQFFAQLEKQNASPKEFEAAERQFVEENEAKLQELEQAAPQALRPDVAILLDATRGRAGLGPAVPAGKVGAAERRVQTYEKANC